MEDLIHGSESLGLPTLCGGTERTPGRNRRDETPDYRESARSHSYYHDPSGGTGDHEHLDDKELAKKLLLRLHELVGPRFRYQDSDIYSRIADIIAHGIGIGGRFALMHFMKPTIFDTDDGAIIEESVVQSYICNYLKKGDEESNVKSHVGLVWSGSTNTPNGSLVPAKAPVSPKQPEYGLVSNLSPPIASLLINLKMMHDDM